MRSRCGVWWTAAVVAAAPGACSSGEAPERRTAGSLESEVLASGLNGPIGVYVESDGTLWISDSGTGGDEVVESRSPTGEPVSLRWGKTARLLRVGRDGTVTEVLTLPSIVIPEGPQGAGRIASLGGTLYLTSSVWSDGPAIERPPYAAAVVRLQDGQASELLSTWVVEKRDNPAGGAVETNPFDLTAGPDGGLWLTDAAGNALYRIDPATGSLELRAVFEALPGPVPNRGGADARAIEAVPTAVAFDGEGDMYVSLLPGLPFLPGTGRVVRVGEDGSIRDYATGLTMLADLVTGPDGKLYGVSIGQFTDRGPAPESGAIVRIRRGTASDTILAELDAPATLVFNAEGDAIIALGALGPPGSGRIVRYPRLIDVR